MAWTSFLSAAGVIHQRAAVYAKLLMWHGATPSSMWLFTGQDIFQMGICDYRDIRMIQEHAHLLHAMHRSSAMAVSFEHVVVGPPRCGREEEYDDKVECQKSDLESAEEKTQVSGSVPLHFGFEHIGPNSVCPQTSLEMGDPGAKALPPSSQLIQAAKPLRRADFAAPVTE
ncbi:hypothetical protein HPB51_014111 [Rhipicephalus microplus]|uniref:Uncharacterized protein n=1 Tax=Rhipicephalus microplus TaxID=6941 RepID=A0A9J6DV14_RHIMP|nr:hypothetical protein HPB51_014111 [Rhipicephalus microplus]